MKYELKAYTIHELGHRDNQEDSLWPETPDANTRLFVLCDGMGGHESGEVASKTVCEAIAGYVARKAPDGRYTDDVIRGAIAAAFDALDAIDHSKSEKKMGTTLTLLALDPTGATIAHIGDSRVYQIRPGKDGPSTKIVFETRDHSLVNDLVRVGVMTEEEAKTSPKKNIITRALQPGLEQRPRAEIHFTPDVRPGDYFYLCSDGMLEKMEDDEIRGIFSEAGGPGYQKKNTLIKNTVGNADNHTAFLVHIKEVEGKAEPRPGADVADVPASFHAVDMEIAPTAVPSRQESAPVRTAAGPDITAEIPAEDQPENEDAVATSKKVMAVVAAVLVIAALIFLVLTFF